MNRFPKLRAADGSSTLVYGTTDTGKIYLIDISALRKPPSG
jgi:hypothetical protein